VTPRVGIAWAAGLTVLLAAAAVWAVTFQAAGTAAGQKPLDEAAARRSVLPEAACGVFVRHTHVSVAGDTLTYHRGYRNADTTGLVGYVIKARGRGYAGYVETLAGVDIYGRVVGLRIVGQKETAGLGDKIVQVKAAAPGALPARMAVDIDGPGQARCFVVGIKDTAALTGLEKAVAGGDSARARSLLQRALTVSDTTALSDPAVAFAVASGAVARLHGEAVPWWQVQFAGKSGAQLVLSRQKDDVSIQGISGATVSCRAVVDPLRAAVARLEQAVAGFKEEPR